eukprot:3521967-Alexandrium_andersonii.AAC.1
MQRHDGAFRLFGLEISQSKGSDGVISLAQPTYLENLREVEVGKKRGDGRADTDLLNDAEIKDFRSLVCGIAWAGIASPVAQCAASLYQSFLPRPQVKHARMLNNFLG